jgi:hypothetical protein
MGRPYRLVPIPGPVFLCRSRGEVGLSSNLRPVFDSRDFNHH